MFDDLEVRPEDYAGRGAVKPAREREQFPCQSCGGSGIYRGVRVHQTEDKCFSCGGRGFFYTSHGDRLKKRAEAAKRKTSKLELAQDAFNNAHPEFMPILTGMCEWNDFARDLMRQYQERGALSENQVAAVWRMHAKAEATRAAKAAERAVAGGTVDLSAIHAMFDKAADAGLKRPTYRAEGLVLSLAKRHIGVIYVKSSSNGDYLGKVDGKEFKATWEAKGLDVIAMLSKIAVNPSQVAKDYGKLTGVCSCCGKELTDPNSIAAGIGPVCATKWGF